MTAGDIVTRARLKLADTGASPRWSTANLLIYVADCQRQFFRVRPDLFMDETTGAYRDRPVSLLSTDAITVHPGLANALAAAVAEQALREDSDGGNLKQAENMNALWRNELEA